MSQCGLPPDLQTPQQYKTDSTNMVGEAQIVRLEAGSRSSVPRKLALNTEILRKVAFDANDYPLAVIAIAGPSQSDNSFMLTCVVRYLQALERAGDRNVGDWMHKNKPDIITKDEGFEFRNRVDQTAEGIWMWTRPFIIKRFETESPIAVVVMATQGCFDPRTNEQDQFSIIGLSLLLSSCFIYNDTRLINENTVSTLTQFMHYGQVASQPFEGKAFQRLLFLIRNCNASGFNHGAVGGQEFIRKCLRMSDDTVRNSKLVEDNFEDYNAYLLPLLGEHMISDDFIGSDGEIKAEVRDHVEKFVVSLVTDVAPKRFGSILASGKTFFHTFENLVTAFNAEDKPSPSSKLDVIVGLDAKISKLTHEYEEQFLQQIESNPASFVSSDTLPKYHQELTLALENKLKGGLRWQICSPKDRQIFANKLHQLLEHKFSEISKQNATKQREFIETTQQSYIQELQDFIKQNMFNTPKIWCRNEYVDKIASFRENIVKEFLKAINGISKEDSKIRRTLISELQEVVHSNWLKLEERKAKADQRATQIIKTWLSHYNMDIDNYVSENGLPNKSTLATLHESNKNSTIQEALNELKKEFVDLDYIRDYENQLEHDIQANFESIKSNLNTQVEEIFGFMKNDLHETVAEFRQQAHIEMQKSSLENANIEAIFERILYKGINSLNSRNHPDHQVVENYTKQLLMDMSTALEEINSLQSRKGRRQECECHFKETTEAFLKEIEVRCPQNDILEEHEVASIVEQLDQSIRPKYERKIQETSPEDYIEFTRNFGEFVAKEKQQIISRNSEKFHQFETRVHGQIKELTETFKLSMKLKEAHWISSDEIISAHNNLMVDLSRRLKSESPLQRYPKLIPKYQNQLEKETQEHFENYISRFELVVRQKNQIVRQIIPEWVSKFQNDIRNDIRSNLFVDKSIIITKIGERTAELVVSLTKYASEAGLNSLFQVEVESILRKEIGNVNVELEIYIKKTTDEYVELIMQSCFQFADNHPILLERSLPELPDFDTAQEKLISDVRGYYDSQWCYPSQSAGQEKATVWDRIHDELMSKCQVLFSELREKSEEESRIVNQITESVLKNVCPTVLNSLNSDRYFEDATLPNLLRDARVAAKNEFQDQVSRKNITLLGYEQTFDEKLDVRLDELSKMNTQITQAAFAEAQEKCNVLFNERRELIKSEVDLSNLRRQAENTVREFLQTKSVVSNTETSLIGSQLHSFIEMLHQKLLEKSIVTSDKAVEVTKDAVRIYSRKMREFRLSRRPVNPENLLEYHHFSWKSTIKRSKKSCFIRNSLDSAIRDRLEYSYEIFQERNYLSHAQDSNFVIGIDLGTTTSCVAVYNNGEVAAITDENGNTLIPCYVYFQEQGSPIAGNEAKDQGIFHPECTIFGAQRMVGRQFNDPQVQNDMKSWPFKIESDNVGGPLIAVKDKRFSPEEVIAEVLRYIKMLAEKHLEGSVTKAVITVPTNFNNSQRGAIRKAASLAGLEVLQIINEPSAAAMAYSLHWKNEEKIILVFNFGDKTFDVTILTPNFGSTNIPDCERSPSSSGVAETVEKTQIQDEESRLQILKIVEDTHLGGDDFNNEMVNYCAETFKHQHGIQLLEVDGSTTGGRDVQQHIRRLGRLKNACEKAKEMLTSADSVTVEVDRMHGDLDLKVPISRSEFERMNENLFQKAITIVKETIEGANLKPQDITDVLTIGGSSRIPRVRKLLQDFLKRPILEINQEVGIQEAVAAGAAIQACVLNGKAAITNLPFSKDIQPFSVGIKLTTGNMSVIIRRNTKIPCEDSRTFSTIQKNQNAISFDIYIGEERVAEDNLFLKTVKLEGIPPAPGDSQNVTVQMKIDANGVLNVTVSTPGGPSSTVTIQDCRGRNSDEELG